MRRVLKWIGFGFAGIVGLVAVAAAVFYVRGRSVITSTYTADVSLSAVPDDSATIERGRHITRIHMCQECHGEDFGGGVFLDIPPFVAVASNLTRGTGGVGGSYTVADWDRAVRHGIGADGRPLIVMPSRLFNSMSDDDAAAMIAYLQTIPAVDRALPPTRVKPLGNIVFGISGPSELRDGFATPPAHAPPIGTAEYGRYLASHTCAECHGPELRGGVHPDPAAPPVTSVVAIKNLPFDAFAAAIRTGVSNGRTLSPYMPWKFFTDMTDDEVRSLHAYVKTIQ